MRKLRMRAYKRSLNRSARLWEQTNIEHAPAAGQAHRAVYLAKTPSSDPSRARSEIGHRRIITNSPLLPPSSMAAPFGIALC